MVAKRFEPQSPRRSIAIGVMIAFHGLLGYALATGLAKEAVELVKRPLTATIIEEVPVPPEPPPPPPPQQIVKAQQTTAPPPPFVPPSLVPPPVTDTPPLAVESVQTPPSAPVVIAPPAEPAPTPVVAAPPVSVQIAVVCPEQVAPEVPIRAVREGINGVVRARITVKSGQVTDVQILSGPRIFHENVRRAMLQYKCSSDGPQEIFATQTFNFQVN